VAERERPRNSLLSDARRSLRSPSGSGRVLSRQEVAEAVNAYLWNTHGVQDRLSDNDVGKLERGEHRWPGRLRREALRAVLGAASDAELGFYVIRYCAAGVGRAACGVGNGLDPTGAGGREPDLPDRGESRGLVDAWRPRLEDEEFSRRTLIRAGLAGTGLGLRFAALGLDDLRHITAALNDARRYLDDCVVDQLRQRLARCAASDGDRGAKAALPAALGVVAVIESTARQVQPSVRRGLLAVGAHAAEFTGWLYRDLGTPDFADYWRDRASEWGQEAGDHAMAGYVLLKKSQSAWDERDGLRMLTLAQAVQEGPWPLPAKVRAEAAQQEARGHAMVDGDLDMVERKLDEARRLFAQDEPANATAQGNPLAAHYDRSLFAVQTAICYSEAGQPEQAVEIYQRELSRSVFSRRDHAYFQVLRGQALTAVSEPDEAAGAGAEALSVAIDTGSVRTLNEVLRLRDRLRTWARRPAVRALCETLSG